MGPIIQYEIPTLAFSAFLGFGDSAALVLAERFLFGRISEARLPPCRIGPAPDNVTPQIRIDIHPMADERATVAFSGLIESPQYEVDLRGFHWDFSKVINCLVMGGAAGDRLLPVHGACLRTRDGVTLVAGASGSGKSSIAFAAMAAGTEVCASELCFIRDGHLVAGNSALTIDRAALEAFGLENLEPSGAMDGSRFQFDLIQTGRGLPVTRVVFPQVHPGEMSMRTVTSRRARMLLFENVVTQLPLVQLLCQETWPIWLPPSRSAIDGLMEEVAALSMLEPVIISGHPREISFAITQGRT